MAKSAEQKAAEVLINAHRDRFWSPQIFAQYIVDAELAIQWEILRTVLTLIKTWRRHKTDPSPYSVTVEQDDDIDALESAVDLSQWD